MKKPFKIILRIFIVIALIIAAVFFYMSNGLSEGSKVTVNSVNASSLTDGEYLGNYEAGRWTNEVSVKVNSGKITDIKIIKDVMVPQKGLADKLFDRVIQSQNTTVDVISGATVTSKAYLKSIENALTK